jgi:adenosine deaminase
VSGRPPPTIDLHRHLEGSVRFSTFVELARETGIELPRRDLRRETTMRGEPPGFHRFLSKFALYRGLYPSRDWITRVACEAVEDAKREGVVHLELRFSPTHFGRRMNARGEDVAEWVARGARKPGISVSFIATFGREYGPKGNRPTTRAVEGTSLFSGIDLAGDESKPAGPFRALFRRLDLPLTIHAGEAGGPENVREAREDFGALRVGHGVRILDDDALLERVRDVTFEVCPTSEIQTGAARSWKDHPVGRMVGKGLKVTVNTDDPSICDTTIGREITALRRAGILPEDIRAILKSAARAAFLPAPARRALERRIGGPG